ncbi:hypothetical protein EOD42_14495 [Rhodovarius crocodyli]|uniref:Uncharacterized protein n=1 Tax=Rhodovarius crocodyli TaxID=1979269 RepID=A0A437MFB7_9PROT|nr:hypothetical protein [Rhodovarius crocodyli]RVT96315.1 hypothetical protein EOD42_14495 [Rhodovarius crocodyli]
MTPQPTEPTLETLGPDALFTVGVLRAWVAPLMQPGKANPDWRDICRMIHLCSEGIRAFDRMMALLTNHARRPIEVRCCDCPQVGIDERHMLRLIGALQIGDRVEALEVLVGWMPTQIAQIALLYAAGFADSVAEAGLRLPPPIMRPAIGVTLH